MFLMTLRPLGKPLLQNIALMHFQLESWTQANVRLDLSLGFTIEPRQVFCRQLCDKQVKLEFLFALF